MLEIRNSDGRVLLARCPYVDSSVKALTESYIFVQTNRNVTMTWGEVLHVVLLGTKVCKKIIRNDTTNFFMNCNRHFDNFKP